MFKKKKGARIRRKRRGKKGKPEEVFGSRVALNLKCNY